MAERDPKQVEIAAAHKLYMRIAGYMWRDSYYNEYHPNLKDLEVGIGLVELANLVDEKEKIVAGVLLTDTTMFEDIPGRFGNRKIWRLTRAGLMKTAKRYGAKEPISDNRGEIWGAYPELTELRAHDWFVAALGEGE